MAGLPGRRCSRAHCAGPVRGGRRRSGGMVQPPLTTIVANRGGPNCERLALISQQSSSRIPRFPGAGEHSQFHEEPPLAWRHRRTKPVGCLPRGAISGSRLDSSVGFVLACQKGGRSSQREPARSRHCRYEGRYRSSEKLRKRGTPPEGPDEPRKILVGSGPSEISRTGRTKRPEVQYFMHVRPPWALSRPSDPLGRPGCRDFVVRFTPGSR